MADGDVAAVPAGAAADIVVSLRREVDAMIRYALGSGTPMPADVMARLSILDGAAPPPLADLAKLHNQLAALVAPASPRTIRLLADDPFAGRFWSSFGPLPNIRRLLLAAIFFLACFIMASLSEHINATTIRQDIYTIDSDHLLHVLIFLMSAAGLGACFNALSTAYWFIQAGTYDPRLDSSYWIRIVLGIIAGLLISQLVPLGGPEALDAQGNATGGSSASLGKPLLALLGGYSASMVNSVLQRLVETVQAMFKGGAAETAAANEAIARAKADHRVEQHKLTMAGDLVVLHQAIKDGAPAERLLELAGGLVKQVAPSHAASSPPPPSPPSGG
jgi:hypothetical protein